MSSLRPFIIAVVGAFALALAFPKSDWAICAPIGAGALFWAWFGVSSRRAFWIGWLAGTVFFCFTFSWFGETAGALIAPYGFFMTLGPAIADGFLQFALAGAAVAFVSRALERFDRLARALAPLGAAAIFAFFEWFRAEGVGVLGVPFGSLGYTQVTSPLAPLAAVIGTYGITFVLGSIGAYGAYGIRYRMRRGARADCAIAFGAILIIVAVAWLTWAPRPGGSVARRTLRVAAIQGNIPQRVKFAPGSLDDAVSRYESLSLLAAGTHPDLIVWPETVIPIALDYVPGLQSRFATLARRTHAELAVGTQFVDDSGAYNVLYFFRPDGGLDSIYRKRQLVPFAERLPFGSLFAAIPWAANASHFASGKSDGVIAVGSVHIGPIICWESAFSALAVGDARAGADALIVATDDAWFGTTAGPYQHAQIAQMRALETGRYIIRAASTGISGIIAPDGHYERRTPLGVTTFVTGEIGAAVPTLYDAIGPGAVAFALALLAIAIVVLGLRPRARA